MGKTAGLPTAGYAAAPPRKAAGGCRGGGWQGGACRWLSLPQGARGAPRF